MYAAIVYLVCETLIIFGTKRPSSDDIDEMENWKLAGICFLFELEWVGSSLGWSKLKNFLQLSHNDNEQQNYSEKVVTSLPDFFSLKYKP